MKLHHFALVLAVIITGFFVTAQINLFAKMQEEEIRRTEYDCLVAAVNAATDAAFAGAENRVTKAGLLQAEEVFFQTLAVLHDGIADKVTWETWKERVPCLVLFEERGYYLNCFVPGKGYEWSELMRYEDGKIPQSFFEETEALLARYHSLSYASSKKYRVEQAGKGVWEQSISPPCVFAIYAPLSPEVSEEWGSFLYASSGRVRSAYYVTADGYCHLPFCEAYKTGTVVARYATQKESAEDGAVPCAECLK